MWSLVLPPFKSSHGLKLLRAKDAIYCSWPPTTQVRIVVGGILDALKFYLAKEPAHCPPFLCVCLMRSSRHECRTMTSSNWKLSGVLRSTRLLLVLLTIVLYCTTVLSMQSGTEITAGIPFRQSAAASSCGAVVLSGSVLTGREYRRQYVEDC